MKPEDIPALPLEYPALYTFRAIGRKSEGLREHVRLLIQSIVGAVPDDAITERASSTGKYIALHVNCIVQSEEMRKAVYMKLHADPQIVFML